MTGQRKRRTKAHVQADIATRYVEWVCARAGFTSNQPTQGMDYGIDLHVQTFDKDGYVESEEIKVQIKSVQRIKRLRNGFDFAVSLDMGHVHYWANHFLPVLLIVYDASKHEAYWLYVQRALAFEGFPLKFNARTRTIHMSIKNRLTPKTFREIAKWKNNVTSKTRPWRFHAF
jgi:hypothetical protein